MNSTEYDFGKGNGDQLRPDDVFAAAQALLGEGDQEVDSDQIAVRLDADKIVVRQVVKQLSEQDRLTASFPTDGPVIVSEVGS